MYHLKRWENTNIWVGYWINYKYLTNLIFLKLYFQRRYQCLSFWWWWIDRLNLKIHWTHDTVSSVTVYILPVITDALITTDEIKYKDLYQLVLVINVPFYGGWLTSSWAFNNWSSKRDDSFRNTSISLSSLFILATNKPSLLCAYNHKIANIIYY